MITAWHDYLTAADPEELARAGAFRAGRGLKPLRETIARAIGEFKPSAIACLGAGLLNDLPYRRMIEAGAAIYLVDWVPALIEGGLAHTIIRRDAAGGLHCIYCSLADAAARRYCRSYGRTAGRDGVCARFRAEGDDPPRCASFRRGERPIVAGADVTAGYACAFGEQIAAELAGVGSWREALRRALALAKRARGERRSVPVPAEGCDLVVSSLLLSQFEFEPYGYFAKQAANLLGAPSARDERRLRPQLERLRDELLFDQIARHCEEIERLLAPEGRCCMAFELFQQEPGEARWFLVPQMHQALLLIAERFEFDLDRLAAEQTLLRLTAAAGPALVLCLMLKRKHARQATP